MSLPAKRSVLTLHEYHKDAPDEGLRCEKADVPPIQHGQCLVAMLHAPINPADINILQGTYYRLPEQLPCPVGCEGCGQVIAVAADVKGLAVGDLVVSWHWGWGAWAQYQVVDQDKLRRVPPGVDPRVASTLSINPTTAWGLLHHVVPLAPGDWVIQNAANSGVGLAVVQVAKAMGVNVINLVRRPEAADVVKEAGAEHVFLQDDPDLLAKVQALVHGFSIHLGLNAVGGTSARALARCLGVSGTVLTYGAMAQEPIPVAGGQLIFKDLRFLGFHLHRWRLSQTDEALDTMWDTLFSMALAGQLAPPIEAEYPLTECKAAVQHALRPHRSGKVLLTM